MIHDEPTTKYIEERISISDLSETGLSSTALGISMPAVAVTSCEISRGEDLKQTSLTVESIERGALSKADRRDGHGSYRKHGESDCQFRKPKMSFKVVHHQEADGQLEKELKQNSPGYDSDALAPCRSRFKFPNSDHRTNFCSKCYVKSGSSGSNHHAGNSRRIMYSVKAFVVCLALLQLVQVMGSGYSKSALTSIERRYRLSTFSVGILQSCFHIGNLSVILFVSYFGSKWNRPRTIAIGSLLMAFSSFLSAMPQFVGSTYQVKIDDNFQTVAVGLYSQEPGDAVVNKTRETIAPLLSDLRMSPGSLTGDQNSKPGSLLSAKNSKYPLCNRQIRAPDGSPQPRLDDEYPVPQVAHLKARDDNLAEKETPKSDSWNDSKLYLFIAVGSVLKGMGHSPLHPLGLSFVDDYATPRNSAVYIGIVSSLSLLGPAFGFILGSLTTGTWVDFGWVDTTKLEIGPHDPQWVGAWWIGYLVTGFLLLGATIPFCMFPSDIPKEEEEDHVNDNSNSSIGCLVLCCNCRSRKSNAIARTERVTFKDEKNYLTDESKDECLCHNQMINGDARRYVADAPERNVFPFYSKTNCPGNSENISRTFDEDHTAQLITYLKMRSNEDANFHSGATSCEIPISCSERWLASPKKYIMKRSASVHGDEHKRLEDHRRRLSSFFQRRKSSAIIPNNSRRPSKLEKLALFDFTTSLKGLLSDPMFLCITLAFVCLTSFLAASVTYISKYMETQFSVTASFANLLNGSINLPMAVVGNLLGGWLIRRFNLKVRETICVIITGIVVTIACLGALLFFQCNQASNVNNSTGAEGGKCATICNCGELDFPVCDVQNDITYRSPCHAGCTNMIIRGKTKVYTECGCMIRDGSANETVPGPCHRPDCSKSHLPVFLGVMGTASLTAGLASTPSSLVVLRIVPLAEKAFAIGIVFVFTRILAWIPAPVYVGYAIDAACLRWTAGSTEESRNHCEIYDKNRLRRNFFTPTGGLLILSLLFYMLALYLHIRSSKFKRKKILKRADMLGFDSPLMSASSPERTPTLNSSPSRVEATKASETDGKIAVYCNGTGKDRNCNEFILLEDEKLLSSTLAKPSYKLPLSTSTPTLASNPNELKLKSSNPKDNIVRATVV